MNPHWIIDNISRIELPYDTLIWKIRNMAPIFKIIDPLWIHYALIMDPLCIHNGSINESTLDNDITLHNY